MTRFWLTLEHGVRFVAECIEKMHGGEIFVPKIPSMSLVEMAAAIAPGCEVEYVGIRAGEKLHEVLVSEDEARNTVELDEMYVIRPAHSWWNKQNWNDARALPEGFRYASDSNPHWLSPEELRELIDAGAPAEKIRILEPQRVPAEEFMAVTSLSRDVLAIDGGSPVRGTLLPYGHQSIDERDIEAVVEILRSDWLTTGPKVGEFEERFAACVGATHAVSFSSGTAALHAAAFAAGLKLEMRPSPRR